MGGKKRFLTKKLKTCAIFLANLPVRTKKDCREYFVKKN